MSRSTGAYDLEILNELREANGKPRLRRCDCILTFSDYARGCVCGAAEHNERLRKTDEWSS